MEPITTHFALSGRLTREEEDGVEVPLSSDEMQEVIEHVLHALNVYEGDGWFRFVDIDSSATLTTGEVRLGWSDYGLTRPGGDTDRA